MVFSPPFYSYPFHLYGNYFPHFQPMFSFSSLVSFLGFFPQLFSAFFFAYYPHLPIRFRRPSFSLSTWFLVAEFFLVVPGVLPRRPRRSSSFTRIFLIHCLRHWQSFRDSLDDGCRFKLPRLWTKKKLKFIIISREYLNNNIYFQILLRVVTLWLV